MNDAARAALAAHGAGLSVVPPKQDGSKHPIGETWRKYMKRRATLEELADWYDQGLTGIGIVCGEVSGDLECLDFDDLETYESLKELAQAAGVGEVVERIETGYLETTPRGGRHWFYRCSEIGGNGTLARPANPKEGEPKTLIDIKSEGGYVVVSPSKWEGQDGDRCYERLAGKFHTIATITPDERSALLALARSLDEVGPPEFMEPTLPAYTGGKRPGDIFNETNHVEPILLRHGWKSLYERNGTRYLCRPGKSSGVSATINHNGRDSLWVFSTSTDLPHDHYLSPFAVLTFLEHDGNFSAAARAVAEELGLKADTQNKVSEQLAELALSHYVPGLSAEGEPFLVPREGPRVARLLQEADAAVKAEITDLYYESGNGLPSISHLSDAGRLLEGKARKADPTQLHQRSAKVGDDIWLDLAQSSGQVVRIGPDGWECRPCPPVVFRHTELTGSLPTPIMGSLGMLRSLLNVTDEDWPLLAGWLVAAMIPDIQHPPLLIAGEQGTAKSTCARMLVDLLDPSPVALRTLPSKDDDWTAAARGSSVIALDNVSRILPWQSDAFCRAVTGDGFANRRFYTNGGIYAGAFRRTLVLTGIDFGPLNGDLLERAIVLELPTIDTRKRLSDSNISAGFAEVRPAILGGLLDCVVGVLRHRDDVRLDVLPRMADHARALAALDMCRDWRCLDAYLASVSRAKTYSLKYDPFGSQVLDFAEGHGPWSGSPTALLQALEEWMPRGKWPNSATALSRNLKKVTPQLASAGVAVEWGGNGHGRLITLRRADDDSHLAETA